MRSVAFVFLALALAASAMPVGFGDELRRSGPAGVIPPGSADITEGNCNPGLVSSVLGAVIGNGGGGCGTTIIPTAGDDIPGLGGVGGVIPGVIRDGGRGPPDVPNPAVGSTSALPARGVDLTGATKGLTGQTGKLAGNTQGAATGAANTVGSNPAGVLQVPG